MHRGLGSFRFGDLPPALGCFDAAADRYAALGVTSRTWPSTGARR